MCKPDDSFLKGSRYAFMDEPCEGCGAHGVSVYADRDLGGPDVHECNTCGHKWQPDDDES